jgi:hypothetical protein
MNPVAVALLACAALMCSAPRCAVAAGLSLGWQDCRSGGNPGGASQNFGCGSTFAEFSLFPAFVLATAVDSVYAMELVIDVDVAADPLPAWWRLDPTGCRAGGWLASASLLGSCSDPWAGSGVAAAQGWLPGTPGGSGRHARLLVAAGAAPGSFVTLEPDVPYTACRVVLKSINTLTCAGCSTPACMVFNSLLIRRLPGSSVEEVFLASGETPGANWVKWQGGLGADCAAVPAQRTTWGAVKALYR